MSTSNSASHFAASFPGCLLSLFNRRFQLPSPLARSRHSLSLPLCLCVILHAIICRLRCTCSFAQTHKHPGPANCPVTTPLSSTCNNGLGTQLREWPLVEGAISPTAVRLHRKTESLVTQQRALIFFWTALACWAMAGKFCARRVWACDKFECGEWVIEWARGWLTVWCFLEGRRQSDFRVFHTASRNWFGGSGFFFLSCVGISIGH